MEGRAKPSRRHSIHGSHQTTGGLYVWLMNGASVSSGAYLTPSRGTDIGWQVRGVADLNGDSKPDLLWQNQSSGESSV